jgi:hypothetical protein
VVLVALLAAIAGFVAPAASAEVTPIGNISDTRRVEFKGIATVHDVIPTDPRRATAPDGFAAVDQRRWPLEGPGHRPHDPGAHSLRDGHRVRLRRRPPYADAYTPKNTDALDALQYALQNAPPGATVNGAVYWQMYRALVT